MVKFFSQYSKFDDSWPIVTLAYFLRYPNPYAAHVLSCDVISREITQNGTLHTIRLIKKTGGLPKWFPKGIVGRNQTWILEESEVDPDGRIVRCRTKNLDHVKIMQVQEDVVLRALEDGTTQQQVTANIVSKFGWGLTKKIEVYGVTKFKANLERSRQGISVVLSAIRESRRHLGLQPLALGMGADSSTATLDVSLYSPPSEVWPESGGSSSGSLNSSSDRRDDATEAAMRSSRETEADSGTFSSPIGSGGSDNARATRMASFSARWLPRWMASGFSRGTTPSQETSRDSRSPSPVSQRSV